MLRRTRLGKYRFKRMDQKNALGQLYQQLQGEKKLKRIGRLYDDDLDSDQEIYSGTKRFKAAHREIIKIIEENQTQTYDKEVELETYKYSLIEQFKAYKLQKQPFQAGRRQSHKNQMSDSFVDSTFFSRYCN
ncbi:hypothetical protein FGO68_gene1597 [Halteria grandinella]|uniref:Uncharacterized protein n=1 Tax=Halteria grandinella TaxID=5974 RepID=A0A8J8T7E9_HALGN|nr:hypothetical protein FGO68_gene1597 [Halteria grandinella]